MNELSNTSTPDTNIPKFTEYMGRSQVSSIFLSDCTSDEIRKTISDLDNGKASDIPIKLIKRSAHVISPILEKCYNYNMKTGKFPDELKMGKITPIYKKGDCEKLENYRPVSTLLQ